MSPTPAPPPLPDERELVERAKVDASAFSELYRHYLPRVHAYAWRRTGRREAAEDVTAATFEAALRALPRFRWGRGGFAPWLFRIAANQVVAHHRREGRAGTERGQRAMALLVEPVEADAFTELGALDPDGALGGGGDGSEALRVALARLNPRYQRAIDLRYLADLDHDMAARALGLAKPAFAVVLSRALKALRRELERLEAERAGTADGGGSMVEGVAGDGRVSGR
ncbi:MAG: RNA polymerase sigma factor [Actinomycetota bacterium]